MAVISTTGTVSFTDAVMALPVVVTVTVTGSFNVSLQFAINGVNKGTVTGSGQDIQQLAEVMRQFGTVARAQTG